MKIETNKSTNSCLFKDVPRGEMFRIPYGDIIWLKVWDVDSDGSELEQAVDLDDGQLSEFEDDREVILVRGRVIVEG